MPVWVGTYTDSDRVASRLQGRILMSDYERPNSVTPVISDEVITLIGNQAEAEITQGLYSLGYAVPLALTSETTRNILAAVAEKEIIYQLLISTDLKAECLCLDSFSIEDYEKLCEDYGETLDLFLKGIKGCNIVLLEETKLTPPCDTAEERAKALPTSVAVISPRSRRWRPPSQIRW